MKKSSLAIALASVLFTGACATSYAGSESVEHKVMIQMNVDEQESTNLNINLDGTEYNVDLSKEAMKDEDVLKSEISHLPQDVQDEIVKIFKNHQSFSFKVGGDGDVKIITKELHIDGVDGEIEKAIKIGDGVAKVITSTIGNGDFEWVTKNGDANVIVLKDELLHQIDEGDSDHKVMIFKTEFENDGNGNLADLIVQLIKDKSLTDEDKQKIRDALEQ